MGADSSIGSPLCHRRCVGVKKITIGKVSSFLFESRPPPESMRT
jgi:hypothetical protein